MRRLWKISETEMTMMKMTRKARTMPRSGVSVTSVPLHFWKAEWHLVGVMKPSRQTSPFEHGNMAMERSVWLSGQ